MLRLASALATATLLLPALASAQEAPTWQELSDLGATWTEHQTREHEAVGEVRILKREINGITCFRGSCDADGVSPAELVAVGIDIPSTKDYLSANIVEAEILSRNGTSFDYYQLIDVPNWTMAKDRFWFSRAGSDQDASDGRTGYWWTRIDTSQEYQDRRAQVDQDFPGSIEVPMNVGGWIFQATDGGASMDYFVCTDSGGALGEGVQSMATGRTLPNRMGEMVEEVRRRR